MKITEAQLSRLVQEFLELDGWRVLKQEPLSRAGGGRYAGELGMPDLLALRYCGASQDALGFGAHGDILWIEVKRAGQKPKPHQVEWHKRERALGAEVWVCDDFDVFKVKYLASGLNRGMRA